MFGEMKMKMQQAIVESTKVLKEHVETEIVGLESKKNECEQDALFNSLVEIGELKNLVRELEKRINTLLVDEMRMNGDKILEYGNLVAERRFSSTRKNWQHETLIEAVVNKALSRDSGAVVDPSSGEIIDLSEIARPVVEAVVDNLMRTAAVREWRVTALRALLPGLNPDDFCEVEKVERVSIRAKQ
jgi:hypothetical protein